MKIKFIQNKDKILTALIRLTNVTDFNSTKKQFQR